MKRKLTGLTVIILLALAGTSWSQDPNIPVALDADSTARVIDSDTLEVTITKTWTERYSKKELIRRKQRLIEQRVRILEDIELIDKKLNIFK